MSETSFVLGPAQIACGDGSTVTAGSRSNTAASPRSCRTTVRAILIPPTGAVVAPGLIDVHTNGADDVLFNRDQGNAVDVATRAYARMGATGYVAGVMTAPWESMMHAGDRDFRSGEPTRRIRPATRARAAWAFTSKARSSIRNSAASIARDWIVPATLDRAHEMIEVCRGALVMVTMAPEMDGVDEVARLFFDQGIVCSAGHTSAHYREGDAGDRPRLSHAHPRLQCDAAARSSRSLAAGRVHARAAHDRAS